MRPKSILKTPYIIIAGVVLALILIFFSIDMINGFGRLYGVNNLNSTEVVSRLKEKSFLILDVRSREEFEVSHILGAKLASDVDLENIETDQPILVYCTVGLRSTELGTTLTKKGFSHIYNLNGGLIRWKNDGQAVYNIQEQPTDSVHVYSDLFGLLLKNGHAVK